MDLWAADSVLMSTIDATTVLLLLDSTAESILVVCRIRHSIFQLLILLLLELLSRADGPREVC